MFYLCCSCIECALCSLCIVLCARELCVCVCAAVAIASACMWCIGEPANAFYIVIFIGETPCFSYTILSVGACVRV